MTLRRSEDAFVDEIYAAAPNHGAPLLRALFPRAFVDPNRESYELDPAMFADPLPDYVNTKSPRVAAGLGTIARLVASGEEIYRHKLRFLDARHRIDAYYRPYHAALRRLLDETRWRFGACLLIDCHSMPSVGGPMDADAGSTRVDFILGDRHGTSCTPAVTDFAERAIESLGYVVARNDPYAGGFTTRHYGQPREAVHALQIEINRSLYMDERTIRRGEWVAGADPEDRPPDRGPCRNREEYPGLPMRADAETPGSGSIKLPTMLGTKKMGRASHGPSLGRKRQNTLTPELRPHGTARMLRCVI